MKTKVLITSLIVFSFLLLGTKCEKSSSPSDFLIGSWTNSYEEQTESGILIYRPADFKEFPLSMYRNTFTLNSDLTCEYLVLAANDGHFMENGTWSYDKDTDILTITYSTSGTTPDMPEQKVVHKFELLAVEKSMLKLKSISI